MDNGCVRCGSPGLIPDGGGIGGAPGPVRGGGGGGGTRNALMGTTYGPTVQKD